MKTTRSEILVLVALAVLFLLASLAYHAIVYDDWTCAFAKCVKVKDDSR